MGAEHEMRARVVLERAQLLALARHLVAQGDDAQDAVHDTVAAALEQQEPPRSPSAWLRQVLRNRVRGAHRRQEIVERSLKLVVEPDGSGDPVAWLEHRRWLDALQDALDDLAEPYRGVVIRRFFEGMSPTEIAQADGDPPATIRWRIHEGLRRLRAHLDDRHGERAWCAAFLALPGVRTMAIPSTVKIGGALAILAIAVSVFAVQSADAPEASTPRVASDEASPDPSSATPANVAAAPAPAEPEPHAPPSTLSEPPPPGDRMELIADALDACIDDLGADRLRGVSRLELDMYTWTLRGGETQIEHIDLTTGRKLMFADEVDESTPVDAPGVTRHDELADCLAYTIDLERFPPMRDQLGRIAATHEHMHGPRGVVLQLDERGHVVREEEPEPLGLPEVEDEVGSDPEAAVVSRGLSVLGADWNEAQVRLVECGSYSCPFCRRSEKTVAAIRERHDDVAFAFLTMPNDAIGVVQATAAIAAERQDQAWAVHRALFAERPADREAVLALAKALELDVERFTRDLDDPEVLGEVARRRQVCLAAGAKGTPTFFVNGDLLVGEVGEEQMSAAIEAATAP